MIPDSFVGRVCEEFGTWKVLPEATTPLCAKRKYTTFMWNLTLNFTIIYKLQLNIPFLREFLKFFRKTTTVY